MTRTKPLLLFPTAALALCLAGSPALVLAQTTTPVQTKAQVTAQALMPAQAAPPEPLMGQQQTRPVPDSFDLKHAVEYGLANNPTMVSARALLQGSEYARKSAFADFFPTATASYGVTSYDKQPRSSSGIATASQTTWNGQLNLDQPVFKGFKLLATYQKAKLQKEQNQAVLAQTELTLISSIQSYYFSHLKAKMDVKSAQDSVDRLQSQLKVTNAFYEVGLKPKLDLLQAQVDLSTAQQTLLTSKNSLETSKAKLNSLLNLPLEGPTTYVGTLSYMPFNAELSECLNQAYKNRPDILEGVKSVAMAEKDQTIAGSSFYPSVTLDYNYYKYGDDASLDKAKYLSNGDKEYWTVGANASWTFFQWGSTYNSYRSSGETVNKLRATLESTKLDAGYAVKQDLLNLAQYAESIRVAKDSVEYSRESYRVALARYQAQVGTNTDLLTAQASVSSSETSLSQALANYQTALSTLYVDMGVKNPSLEER